MEYTKVTTVGKIEIWLGRGYDESPDLSHYGKFCTMSKTEQFYVNRDTGELFDNFTVVAEKRGVFVERHSYGFITGFQIDSEFIAANDKMAATEFAKMRLDGTFKKYQIAANSRVKPYGYWVSLVYMLRDADRLEKFADNEICMEFLRAEARFKGRVLAEDSIGGIESDDNSDPFVEWFNVDSLVEQARDEIREMAAQIL